MAWNYDAFADDDVTVVIEQARRRLNDLRPAYQSNSAKVAASNQSHGNARSVVVFHTEDLGTPAQPSGAWARYTWQTGTDYETLYNNLVNALNNRVLPNGEALSDAQAYWSVIEMSNARDGNATLSLFYCR